MKLIAQYNSANEADIVALHYREKGILTHVSSRYSNGLRLITGATVVGLWIVLDEQYADALLLSQNIDHNPAAALTEEEMIELEQLTKTAVEDSSTKILFSVAYGAVVMALAGYIVYLINGLLIN